MGARVKVCIMNRFIATCLLVFAVAGAMAQGVVKGKILSKTTNEPLEFINVMLSRAGETKIMKGAITDVDGNFVISGVPTGSYVLKASFTGYRELTRQFSLTATDRNKTFTILYMADDTQAMKEVTVTGQRAEMKLEVDRKSFSVDQQIANAGGSASDVLENIPSVEVDNDGNISLRGNESVEVWINGKASGLTTDNRAQILQQLPAESIDRIEVIDNPSAKFSAEGSAGIINIVLKKDRKAGYYGSVQAGADTRGGANASFNFNFNSSKLDGYANVGYRHHRSKGGAMSEQTYPLDNTYQNYSTESNNLGNNLFSRLGLTWHATSKDDLSLSGMMMLGGRNGYSSTPYYYGTIGAAQPSRMMARRTHTSDKAQMYHGELNYRHNFSDKHFLDFVANYNSWKSDAENEYQDSTEWYDVVRPVEYSYQSRPLDVNSKAWELKLDYENQITKNFKLQAGYNGRFSKEDTPQESYEDPTSWHGGNAKEDQTYYNRFVYKMDVHALYATANLQLGRFGVMAGLRGEYWKVDTRSYDWLADHQPTAENQPVAFKKDYFQLFPSVFLSYQLTPSQQLQVNYTRRLRRPWGGQLNSFKNTRDATVISFGNPELTPEYSNSFSLNYLKTWAAHSLLVSAYYRPTTNVMQRITYQSSTDGLMYQTHFNVAKSTSTGLELTAKNKLFRILDITTSANFYYYKINGYDFSIDNQTIHGEGSHSFTWNARLQASLMLPYDISFQVTGRYRSKQVTAQGYRKPSYNIDLGLRKTFLNKKLTLAVNCRDLLNSRRWKNYTESETFTRHQENWHNGRSVRFTLTWNFGNNGSKRRPQQRQDMQEEEFGTSGYESIGTEE